MTGAVLGAASAASSPTRSRRSSAQHSEQPQRLLPSRAAYNAETGAAYDCSDDCAKSLTTAWNYCQTTFYMRVQEWDAGGRAFLLALEAGAPDLASESTKGPCAAKQESLILDALAAVESDPQCGPLYDACVADSWCLFNMRAAVQALQSEYVRPSFEEKLCDSDKSTAFQRLYDASIASATVSPTAGTAQRAPSRTNSHQCSAVSSWRASPRAAASKPAKNRRAAGICRRSTTATNAPTGARTCSPRHTSTARRAGSASCCPTPTAGARRPARSCRR